MLNPSDLEVDRGLAQFWNGNLTPSDFVNRDRISSITILLTYRCPASCSHCLFESSPRKKDKVDVEIARKLIEAASRQSPPPSLSFSGGEAFLRLDEMKDLASFALNLGITSEVISSSAWVRNAAHARDVLADLAGRGMQTYCTSVDPFHTPFVKAEKMRIAILAAQEVGMRVIVNSQTDRALYDGGQTAVLEYLSGVLNIPQTTLLTFQINPLVTTPVGRARTDVQEFLYNPGKDMREGCPMATEIVTLSPYGFLYPCCGMVLGEKPEQAGLFIQDNLTDKSVDEIADILDDLKHDLFFKILQVAGPYEFLMELRRRNPALQIRDQYVGSCDACLEFTNNPAIAEEARAFLVECGERFARAG